MADDDLTRSACWRWRGDGTECQHGKPPALLAIPHLLNRESAASYQGYLLAYMAVAQTRAHLLRRRAI
jgi:hypothetical protein